jgi:hypothetical protein
LPVVLFSYQKSQFGGPWYWNVDIFYDHLEYFTATRCRYYMAVWSGLSTLFLFCYVWTKKNLATLL